jgi:hypothetical protein
VQVVRAGHNPLTSFDALGRTTSLRELHLARSLVARVGSATRLLPNLELLDVQGCANVTDAQDVAKLATLTSLVDLNLSATPCLATQGCGEKKEKRITHRY